MKIITTVSGFDVNVSDEDYLHLNQFSWYTVLLHGKVVGVHRSNTLRKSIPMSHEILLRRGIKIALEVDHKDRDQLNNQFQNLRPATRGQNNQNQGPRKSNLTGYKGVSFLEAKCMYRARIQSRKAQIHLGLFHDPILAAKVYDRAAKRLFGEFAVLNFPEGDP
jgi:hypothetical protein